MKRFYIHVCHGEDCARDHEGVLLPNLQAACTEAQKDARFLVAAEINNGADDVEFKLRIEDETGASLAALPISAKVLGLA